MIYIEDGSIKVGGTVLPGTIKSMEVTGGAKIEEQEVEGSSTKPKQATGYEDAKVTLEIVVDDTGDEAAIDKVRRIEAVFRPPGQTVPQPLEIVDAHLAARGVSRVLVKGLVSKEEAKRGYYTVTLTLWEYVPLVIATAAGAEDDSDGAGQKFGGGQALENSGAGRKTGGGAGRTNNNAKRKTAQTPSKDDRKEASYAKNLELASRIWVTPH